MALTIFAALLVEYLVRRNRDHPIRRQNVDDSERAAMLSGRLGGRSVQIAAKRLAIMLCVSTTLLGIRYGRYQHLPVRRLLTYYKGYLPDDRAV